MTVHTVSRIVCDTCHHTLEIRTPSLVDAVTKARTSGWTSGRNRGGRWDLCDHCTQLREPR